MRIKRVHLSNYRQFRSADVSFAKGKGADLHVFLGENGAGKTNLLNAINWCLYDDEPHLSRTSQALQRPNLAAIEESEDGGVVRVEVQLDAKTVRGVLLTFKRTETYRVHLEGDAGGTSKKAPIRESTRFSVIRADENGDSNFLTEEEAETEVNRFVPRRMREFFLFDCERLDTYFREATAQNIRHAIFQLSGIDLLQRVEEHLEGTLKDLRKESSRVSPVLGVAENELAEAEAQQQELNRRVEGCQGEVASAKQQLEYYRQQLHGVEEILELEKRREELNNSIKKKSEARARKADEKAQMLLTYGTFIGFRAPAEDLIETIESKRESKEIPPAVSCNVLEESLIAGVCKVCQHPLDKEAREQVEGLLEEIRVSSETAGTLLSMEPHLTQILERIAGFSDAMGKVTLELQEYERDLATLQTELTGIDEKLTGYETERIAEISQQRLKFEEMLDDALQRLGQLKQQKAAADERVDKAREAYDEQLKRSDEAEELKTQIHFCDKSLNIVRNVTQSRMRAARKRIQSGTTQIFKKLVWKKSTFAAVEIDDHYSLGLTHVKGYECLGSVSAAERQLLALSFTLALHELSGFDSPIVIDTPVARVTGKNRASFAEVLGGVATSKQVILIFTPAEYSADVSTCLSPIANSRYEIVLDQSESEARMENLKNGE